MARPSKTRRLSIWMNGEPVGTWTVAAQGRHELRYTPSWLASPAARPLSLSLPLIADQPHRGERVESFFDNLLPDSAEIRRRVQARFGTRSTRAFDLLAEIGRDCVGAVQLTGPDDAPPDVRRITADPLDEAAVARALRATTTPPPLGQREDDAFRISLAGAQEKAALLWHREHWWRPRGATPTTHILKLPLGPVGSMQADFSTSVENEWLCARVLAAFGEPVAPCRIAAFEDQRVLVVERFDRRLAPDRTWWMRLPQEDLCQATGTPPGHKYEADGGPGIEASMALLLGARSARTDRRRFLRAQILFWMLAAPDGHAKNFSVFLEPGGAFSLTPLYDVMSAYPILGHGAGRLARQDLRMAMAVTGARRHYDWTGITRRHWATTAHRCGLGADLEAMIDELLEQTPAVVARVATELPRGFPAGVADPILRGLETAAATLAGSG